ncbi:N-acyl-D-amino-acid deacylase family protein [Embleya hyalina]|uniref:Amidohydrolase n=1 Tax=Embleya hyalina TaxID=516124 RepID=A0A401YIQ1_9ACTN|nr:amidohydrolase family protein [Embleya hyalina]GCD94490.1 amidohydrolase [Embleya hyalina]
MANHDLVIKGGIVVDGSGNPRRRADVAITDGVITAIGRVPAEDADRVIDATGLIVAPGFIDLHTHYDGQVFWDPYLTTSGPHGVTSVVTGNCGFGFAPVREDMRDRAMLSMTAVEDIPTETLREGMPWDWVTFPEYLDSVERTPKAVNVLPYVPVNPLLIWVLGLERAKAGALPTDAEHVELARLLTEAMEAGAGGWSAQCLGEPGNPNGRLMQGDFDGTPMPTDIMWPQTRLALAEALAGQGRGFMQVSGTQITEEEYEHLVEVSGRPLIWNAVIANSRSGGLYRRKIEWLRSCQERGIPIYGQAMTTDVPVPFSFLYGGVSTRPPVATIFAAETVEAKIALLNDPVIRAELREFDPLFYHLYPDMKLHRTFTEEYKPYEGLSFKEIGARLDRHPVDVLCDVTIADGLTTQVHTGQFNATLEGLKELVDYEYLLPGLSDGGAHLKTLSAGMYGTEYIVEYVRKHAWTSLEQAHWRLSGLPARCAGFTDRGVLDVGAAADIIVYDYDELAYGDPQFVHDLPGGQLRTVIDAKGYRHILVNGRVTVENDRPTGVHSGELLRHGRANPR